MVSMPNPLIPPSASASAAVGIGIALAFLRTRSHARPLIVMDALILAFALIPTQIAANLLRGFSSGEMTKENSWLIAITIVAIPLAYLPPRIAWMANRRIIAAVVLGALLAFTRILGELILAVAEINHFTIATGVLLLLSLAGGILAARFLPSR
jgi:hypothetical protein